MIDFSLLNQNSPALESLKQTLQNLQESQVINAHVAAAADQNANEQTRNAVLARGEDARMAMEQDRTRQTSLMHQAELMQKTGQENRQYALDVAKANDKSAIDWSQLGINQQNADSGSANAGIAVAESQQKMADRKMLQEAGQRGGLEGLRQAFIMMGKPEEAMKIDQGNLALQKGLLDNKKSLLDIEKEGSQYVAGQKALMMSDIMNAYASNPDKDAGKSFVVDQAKKFDDLYGTDFSKLDPDTLVATFAQGAGLAGKSVGDVINSGHYNQFGSFVNGMAQRDILNVDPSSDSGKTYRDAMELMKKGDTSGAQSLLSKLRQGNSTIVNIGGITAGQDENGNPTMSMGQPGMSSQLTQTSTSDVQKRYSEISSSLNALDNINKTLINGPDVVSPMARLNDWIAVHKSQWHAASPEDKQHIIDHENLMPQLKDFQNQYVKTIGGARAMASEKVYDRISEGIANGDIKSEDQLKARIGANMKMMQSNLEQAKSELVNGLNVSPEVKQQITSQEHSAAIDKAMSQAEALYKSGRINSKEYEDVTNEIRSSVWQ